MVRFDQPCYAAKGAVEYFREHMAVGEYLTEHGRAEMTWFGQGAARLGLSGRCTLADFSRLCAGLHPGTGARLMVRDKGTARRVCYFGQISPPKDVSILHLVGGDDRIAGWWSEAVRETLHEMEAVAATRVRRGRRNADRPTGCVVVAIVTHEANRALDPQLHTHLCLMNLTWDEAEGRWKGLQASGFYRHQGYFREVCYNHLARRMREAGYEIEPARKIGFTVTGLPGELRETFSKRRQAILREAAAAGAATQDELQQVTLETRARKTSATAAELRDRWLEECGPHRSAMETLIGRANGRSRTRPETDAAAAVASAMAHLFERVSVADERVLLREALAVGRGEVALGDLKTAVESQIASGVLLRSGSSLVSRDALEAEREFTGWVHAQREAHAPLGEPVPTAELSPEQAAAVTGLLRNQAAVAILQGDAGTGKTASLRHLVTGVTASGSAVLGCAPSAAAVQVLRTELTPEAVTLQRLLVDENLQSEVQGRVILLDEAGLVSAREMRDLCRLAARNAHRIVLVGDIKQHHSVEAGDALRALQKFAQVPTFRLTGIRRQRDPAYRRAVACLARGDAWTGLALFRRLGAVHACDRSTLWQAAAADYVRTLRESRSCLAISPVWSEIHAFIGAVRTELKAAGLLAREERAVTTIHSLKWTKEEKRRPSSYRAGDVISFHQDCGPWRRFDSLRVVRREDRILIVTPLKGGSGESAFSPSRARGFDVGLARDIPVAVGERLLIRANLPEADLRNGDIVEAAGLAASGDIHLRDGRSIPSLFREFSHGYATTSHAAQGRTVDHGILLMAAEGIASGNLKQAYVSNSRFRESQAIYTTDWHAARDAMMRPADRKLALELVVPAGESVIQVGHRAPVRPGLQAA